MNNLSRQAKILWRRKGSTILTCVGGAGVIATTVMAIKATPKATELLKKAKEEKGKELTMLEKVKVAGPVYIPTVITGAATLTCIFGANVLNKRQQASLMSAYALLDEHYKDYISSTKEVYGEDAEQRIKENLIKGKFEKTSIIAQEDETLFYESFSGRFFTSSLGDVRNAEYHFNRNLQLKGYMDLNELYEFLGIPEIECGYYMGWNLYAENDYGYKWVDFDHYNLIMDDGTECVAISMPFEPHYDFMDY